MKNLIDTIFKPLLTWLNSIYNNISELSVPMARPVDLSKYLGVIGYFGPYWTLFITTAAALAFIYVVSYVIVSQRDTLIQFKNLIKWW